MTYTEALEYVSISNLSSGRIGLGRMWELLMMMGAPHKKGRYIHVAGTNGKGSTAMMTASVLRCAGFTAGLYTSPHLMRVNERIQIGSAGGFDEISNDAFAEIAAFLRDKTDGMYQKPIEFELLTAMAFEYFARRECGFAVLETGMGGRLDATNLIETPECSVITTLGFDHVAELGNTLESIAWEKAGIVKPGCPVVLYDQDSRITDTVTAECDKQKSPLYVADFDRIEQVDDSADGQVFRYKGSGDYHIPLLGAHQLKNAAVALETVDVLRGKGFNITEEQIRQGLESAVWPGRFEVLHRNPHFIVDGGHNSQCAETVSANISKYFPGQKAVMLIGVLADKDLNMLSILDDAADSYICISPDSPRALPQTELAEYVKRFNKPVFCADSIEAGVETAMKRAGDTTGIACAVGSLHITGAVRACFGRYT